MDKIRNSSSWILLAGITFIIMYACSYYTHPGWRIMAFDQDIFYVIGRNWANGNIPYLTTWDSKGPIIFFTNMLGYLITKSELGVFILQSISMICVSWSCYWMASQYCSKKESLIFIFCLIASYVVINSGGNQVGDCTLLLSAISTLLTYRWSRNVEEGKASHPWIYATIYGMYFASCLFSRLTNAMMLCASILIILCVLSYHKYWRNLLYNALAFIAGSSIIALPIIIYFYSHHALQDMWYATFIYNIEYAIHSRPEGVTDTHFPILYFVFYNICLVSILIFSTIAFVCNDRKKIAYIWLPVALATMGWIFKSYANANYTISFLPILMISLIELSTLYHKTKKPLPRYALYGICLICVTGMANYIRIATSAASIYARKSMEEDANHQINMIRQIPHNDSFIIYNGLPYIYATQNIKPYYPYWICQDWAIENGLSLRQKVRECYQNGNVKWIIAWDYKHSNIKNILLKKYDIQKEEKSSKLTLFKLKETR